MLLIVLVNSFEFLVIYIVFEVRLTLLEERGIEVVALLQGYSMEKTQ